MTAPAKPKPPAKTNAERQNALRDARRAAGLVRLELWLHPDDHERIKAYADRLARARTRKADPPIGGSN